MCKYKTYEELPIILNVIDISEVLGVSKNNAYYLCRSKDFPIIRIGKQFRIPKDKFWAWLETVREVEIA